MDVNKIRADFPVFDKHPDVVFLDTAASSQKPKCVLQGLLRIYEESYANVHRGVYGLSQAATCAYELGRSKVAEFVNAPSADNVVFTRGATEAINLVAQAWGRNELHAGDEVIITELEHHANIVPWQMLREEIGITLTVAPIKENGAVNAADIINLFGERTKLVALAHVSNALGTVLPIEEVIEAAAARGIKVLVDGCQAVPRMAVDVQALGADFYVFSGHKMYATGGIGCLIAKTDVLDAMPPWQGGGDMIEQVTWDLTTYAPAPAKFEAGTPAIADAANLATTCDYLNSLGMEAVEAHERELTEYATEELLKVDGLSIIGTAPNKIGVMSFIIDGIPVGDIGMMLDEQNVAVRCGHHCAQPLMHRFGVEATVRASFGVYSTKGDVDKLVAALLKVRKIFS